MTVIIGAKASQPGEGSEEGLGDRPKDAKIENLDDGDQLRRALGYMELLKRAMHEMTGVPVAALGQMQPISNTRGVALAGPVPAADAPVRAEEDPSTPRASSGSTS